MECPFQKETTFGKAKGYYACTNPKTKVIKCFSIFDCDVCPTTKDMEHQKESTKNPSSRSGGFGIRVSDGDRGCRVSTRTAVDMLEGFFLGAIEQTGGFDIDGQDECF